MTDLILPDPGGKITEPGAYRLTMDRYHDPFLCIGPSVSSSGLRTIELQSPWDFWAFSGLNPDRFEKGSTDAFDFGKAAHALLLGDEDFGEHYEVRPDDFKDYRTKGAREWLEGVRASGKTPVTPDDLSHIVGMSKSMAAHGLPQVIFGGEPEVSLLWKDKTGVWVKARPDALPSTGDLGDLKTTADASTRACKRDITKHGYFMQMALCVEGMERVLGRRPPEGGVVLIFVQKKPPYTVTAIPISENALYWGKMMNRRALNTFAECLEAGHWPSDGENMPEYDIPEWMEARLGEEQADKSLPNHDDDDGDEPGDDDE